MTMFADLDRLERTRPRCSECGKVQYVTSERAMHTAVFLAASGIANRRLVPFFQHGTWHLTSKNRSRHTEARRKRRRASKSRRRAEKRREQRAQEMEQPMTDRDNVMLPPDPTGLRIGDGPWAALAALASGDPVKLAEAKTAQREYFRSQFGCYPEDAVEICPECESEACPIWRGMLPLLKDRDEAVSTEARHRLRDEHTVAEIPCRTCGGELCTIFFCYADEGKGGAK